MAPLPTPVTRRNWLKAAGIGAAGLPLGCLLFPSGRSRAAAVDEKAAALARQIEEVLWKDVLDAWFPRCLDETGGGFHEDFSEDWSKQPAESKFIVFQARMTWTPAAVAGQYPRHRNRWLSYGPFGKKCNSGLLE